MGIRVTLGNEPLAILPGASFAWALSYGPKPFFTTLETTVASADRIRQKAEVTFKKDERAKDRTDPVGPLTLTMWETEGPRRVDIDGVYAIVGNRPGKDYNTAKITLTDRRWLFERTMVERSYNIRRKSGDYRLVGGALVPVQLAKQRADVVYHRATLFNGKRPWTSLEVLEDVLKELCGEDGYVLDTVPKFSREIEGLDLHENGADALGRVLSYVPGAQVYVGYDGKIHLASIYDLSEKKVFETFGPGNVGHYRLVDKSLLRPKTFRVFSDKEVELRFDYIEEKSVADDVSSSEEVRSQRQDLGEDGKEPLWLENVIINPLYYLPLDPLGSRVATQGEPVPAEQFIDAINFLSVAEGLATIPLSGVQSRGFQPYLGNYVVTNREIRRHWMGNWPAFRAKVCLDQQGIYNPERLKLLAALRTHWRQTYRILPQWRDKIRSIHPIRSAILDYETATRAPASVHTQYLTKFSQLGYDPAARGIMTTRTDDYADDLSDASVSPFTVEVLDSDIGLFRITPKVDQTGTAETYVVGDTEDGELPAADVATAAVFWNQVSLDRGFKLAVIMTAVQATPNDERRLHVEEIDIGECAKRLGITTPSNRGPDYELLQTSDTARYAWADSDAARIREAFYEGKDYPPGLLSNREEITELSIGAATSELVSMLDKVEGRVTGPLTKISPTGNLRSVVHVVTVGSNNETGLYTTIEAPGDVPAPNIYSLLPDGVRRKVRRLVQQ